MSAASLVQQHSGRDNNDLNGHARLRLHHNPLRLLASASPWTAAAYLGGYLLAGSALFTVAFTMTVTAGAMAITWIGLPLLTAAVRAIRWSAQAERRRLRLVLPGPVPAAYQKINRPAVVAQARGRWRDPATRRDSVYLIALYLPLLVMDSLVFSIWAALLAGITVPAWYWAIPERFPDGQTAHGLSYGYFPHGPHGPGAIGLWAGTFPSALLAAAVALVLFLIFNYALVATARLHARIACALLRPFADPLS